MNSPNPAKETLGRTVEEALGKLTHQCIKYPALKLLPQACAKRRATKQRIAHGKSYPIFDGCKDCPGPIPIDGEIDTPSVEPAPKPASRKKKMAPTVCKVCGKGQNETRWYSSNPNVCAECLYDRERQRKLNARKTYSEIKETENMKREDPPPAEEQSQPVAAEIPPEVIPETYVCEVHGLHAGRMFGKQKTSICPKCHREKMSVKMKSVKAGERQENGASGQQIVLPQWIGDWAEERAAAQGIPGRELIIGMIGEQIPNEWLKAWLIKTS